MAELNDASNLGSPPVATGGGGVRFGWLDIAVFNDWSTAVSEDVTSGLIDPLSPTFEPNPGTRSGFLFERIRPEFWAVMADWLERSPITNPDAPATPFEMAGHQNGDNHLLSTVLFASVLFFAGVPTKVLSERNRLILLWGQHRHIGVRCRRRTQPSHRNLTTDSSTTRLTDQIAATPRVDSPTCARRSSFDNFAAVVSIEPLALRGPPQQLSGSMERSNINRSTTRSER